MTKIKSMLCAVLALGLMATNCYAETGNVSDTEELEPVITGIYPDPVIVSEKAQVITLIGRGFEPGTKIAISSKGKVSAVDPSLIHVRDSQHMEISITTGAIPSKWAVQLSSPDNSRSNIYRFDVKSRHP